MSLNLADSQLWCSIYATVRSNIIKILLDALYESIQVWFTLKHPYVCTLIDTWQDW